VGILPQPHHVCTETISTELRLRTPYRGVETGRATLRIRVLVAPRHQAPHEVVIDVDDLAVEVRSPSTGAQGCLGQGCLGQGCLVLGAGAIDALFVVERQPPSGFLTWFGVFARRRGRADRLVLETPEPRVARYVERTIEDRLGLDDEPVRGELRVLL
jgi:hypothetical protein